MPPLEDGSLMKINDLQLRSIRTKFLLLVASVAAVVGGVSVLYSYFSNNSLLQQQVEKRGHYIVDNLAYNSKYGVLTEDRPILSQLLDGAVSAGGGAGQTSDVVGAMIRDAEGGVVAQLGESIEDLPDQPAASRGMIEARTASSGSR